MNLSLFINNNNENSNDQSLISELSRVKNTDAVPAIKYLGVYFDPNLNFKFHIQQLSSTLSRALYSLKCVKNFLPVTALKTLYYSLIHCHLTYAVEIWSCTTLSNLSPLIKKQKIAVRLINKSKFNTHTEPLFKKSEILPLNLLADCTKIKFFHGVVHNFAPSSFANEWARNRERRHQDAQHLRNNDDFQIPYSRLTQFEKFPLTNLPRLWNNLPDELSILRNKFNFNAKLKIHLLSSLNSTVFCNRLLCPSCHLNAVL